MTTPRFKNKDGSLTKYALACGYIEQVGNGRVVGGVTEGLDITLWMEHEHYHVRAHDFSQGKRLMWETFDNVTEARKCYRQAKRQFLTKS